MTDEIFYIYIFICLRLFSETLPNVCLEGVQFCTFKLYSNGAQYNVQRWSTVQCTAMKHCTMYSYVAQYNVQNEKSNYTSVKQYIGIYDCSGPKGKVNRTSG